MPAPSASRRLWLGPLLIWVMMGFVGWSYYVNALTNGPLTHREPAGYYGFLTDAFVSGQVHLKIIPDPKLLRLADPYGGPQGASRPHDMSFYRGKFYLYYGATPALVLMVPWHVLTGGHLSEYTVTMTFCYAGFVLSVYWLYGLRRRLFPEVTSFWFLFCVTILGFGSPLYFSSVNPTFYPVPISAAFFCLTVAGVLIGRSLRTTTATAAVVLLACASLSLALCVGARPNYVLCLPLLLIPALWLWKFPSGPQLRQKSVLLIAAAMIVPAALVGLGLAFYNYFRFGSPTEFGIQYSLASASVREIKLTGFEYYPKNLRLYLLHAADFIRYFPFVFSGGRPFGLLPHFTLACAAILLPLTWFSPRLRRDRVWFVGNLFWLGSGVANLAFLCFFFGGEYRYLVDFAPSALLVACALLLAAVQASGTRTPALRRTIQALMIGVGTWTLINGVLLTFADRPPSPFLTTFERASNRLVYALEQLGGGAAHGPIELKLRFPTDRIGLREPLLTTGALVHTGDIIYVYYTDRQHMQFGFFHLGAGGPLSEPVAIDYTREHTLKLELGSLYPPREHPLFRTWTTPQVDKLRRRLALTLDGAIVLQASVDVYRSTPDGIQIGANSVAPDVCASLFSGKLLSTRRLGVFPPKAPNAGPTGPVRLTLRFPPIRGGTPLPLVSTGEPGAGDLLSLQILEDGRVRFTHDSWGGENFTSPPFTVGPGATHRVTVEMGSLYPADDARIPAALRRRLAVWLDDQPVMDVERPFNSAKSDSVEFGFNAIGGSGVSGMFTGTLLRIERVPTRAAATSTAAEVWGPLACDVRFPTDALGRAEPLLCTGVFGAADIVFVEYLDNRHVRFGHDHWGTGVVYSGPIVIDYTRVHALTIKLGSLYPPDTPNNQLQILLDGRSVLSIPRPAHLSRPAQVTLGRNDVGASTCQRIFSGEFMAPHRLPY
jgi:hypothetical protein